MIAPDAAVQAAARYISRSVYGQEDGPDAEDLRHGRELVLAIAPLIAGAERQRICSHISPDRLEEFAGELDDPEIEYYVGQELQPLLRQWAAVLRGRETAQDGRARVFVAGPAGTQVA